MASANDKKNRKCVFDFFLFVELGHEVAAQSARREVRDAAVSMPAISESGNRSKRRLEFAHDAF
jgi:hypothetical protein